MSKDKKPFVFDGFGYEDLELAIISFEQDYGFTYANDAFTNVKSIAELIDVICAPISKEQKKDCTSQQAFYKLKSVLQKYADGADITPKSQLETLIGRKDRIATIGKIERELGFDLKVLKPTELVEVTLWAVLLCLIIMLFFIPLYALVGLVMWFFVCKAIYKDATEFKVETVGELVNQMVLKNYFKSRRNSNTMNEQELRKVVVTYLADNLGLTEEEFLEAQFG